MTHALFRGMRNSMDDMKMECMQNIEYMRKEVSYTESAGQAHIKAKGQYFTHPVIADFMCEWACKNAGSVLDPAVGNSIFLRCAARVNPGCALSGYEVDEKILEFFGNPASAKIYHMDYLLNGWAANFDAIVCNPPYSRFQAVENRAEILKDIYAHTGIEYSSYTNLYLLFLIKSIFQMSPNGRLAYIVPTEFLNSKYGTAVKQLMIDKRLLRAIINFQNDSDIFFNATTTCCILLIDHAPKDNICFYNVKEVSDLKLPAERWLKTEPHITVGYDVIRPDEKWRKYLFHENRRSYRNLVNLSRFCLVSRGIATGANDFYCLNRSKIQKYKIDMKYISECICRSADVKSNIFTKDNFKRLSEQDKTVYLLDIKDKVSGGLTEYIRLGENEGVDKKYLPSCRNPWYLMEQKATAPIWVSTAGRGKIKFVRNLAGAKTLTTFHSVYIHEEFKDDTDFIFCYFLTPIAQTIIRNNRKALGNGLEKFQPNDFNTAQMLDLTRVSLEDRRKVLEMYHDLEPETPNTGIQAMNEIFTKYLTQ